MSWDQVIGQQRVKELLKRAITSNRVAHAYLFCGEEGTGKDAMAIEFVRALNCKKGGNEACDDCSNCKRIQELKHPDVRFICALPVGKGEKAGDDPIAVLTEDQLREYREQIQLKANNPYHRISIGKATFIKLNSVRELRREAAMTSVEGKRKIFIISNADTMNAEASNSILKTLEEPSSNTVFILTSSQKDKLLPTIVSRCQLVAFDPLTEAEIKQTLMERQGVDGEQAALAARLANGSYTAAVAMLTVDMITERRQTVHFLRCALGTQKVPLVGEIERVLSASDRAATERWLRLLQVWLRDALVLREQGASGLMNVDQLDDLKSFVEKFPRADIVNAMERVERSIALVNKNVYLPLVLTSLAIDLRHDLSSQ